MRQAIHSAILGLTVLALGVLGQAPAVAGEVYQWKDAQGVTHYSGSPPPKGAYKQRVINRGGQAQTATVATTAPAVNPQCTTARKNLELLQGQTPLQQDTDGDGKGDKTLSDAERVNQMELAQATIKVSCPGVVASKP